MIGKKDGEQSRRGAHLVERNLVRKEKLIAGKEKGQSRGRKTKAPTEGATTIR